MKLYHAAEMREADERAAAAGVSGETLMENAGAAVAREVLRRYPGTRRAVILCGKGNNGGDGYVCARKLRAAGLDVKVLELSPEPNRTDAARARTALLVSGAVTAPLTGVEDVRRLVAERTVIVDALLGSGLDRSADGWLGGLLSALSGLGAPVVAIDVPSGLPTDTPQATGPHVTADVTVELAGRKVGGAFPATSRHYGVRVLAPIGMPSAVLAQVGGIALLDAEAVRAWLPARERSANKYTAGTVTVVAGSGRYAGAAELACRGAWRAGAGLVTLVGPERHPSAWPETIFERAEAGRARGEAVSRAVSEAAGETMGVPAGTVPDAVAGLIEPKRAAALVIGPGLAEEFLPHLPELLTLAPGPVVLDAAALGALAAGTIALGVAASHAGTAPASREQPGAAVLTPHAGEAAALLGTSTAVVTDDPLAAANDLAARYGAVVVLKGATTVIAAPDGRLAVSERGHPGMAAGGTGDVLAGVLGAVLAPAGGREEAFERACAAVWLHGVAGEVAARRHGIGLVASDVAEGLPDALAGLR